MEVHPHTHTARKKWTHYFWEFLMLFFAVTLGFFVENQREHYIEHQREKQFIRSLVNDIRADTARINTIIAYRTVREERLDSLTAFINGKEPEKHTGRMYSIAVIAARTLLFRYVPNDGTMQQLKNSGAFRLIRDPVVRDSIAKYDVSVRNYLRQAELEETLVESYRSAATKIFDALEFERMLDENNIVVRDLNENPSLLQYQPDDLHVFNYRMYSMKALNKANRRDGRLFLKQAENLLQLLKKKYHLE
jgi:hypothetical protein